MTVNRLHVLLEPLPHPSAEDRTSVGEAWGRILLRGERDGEIERVLDWQWNLEALAEWWIEHGDAVCQDELAADSSPLLPGETLCGVLARLYDRSFGSDEDDAELRWFEALGGYWHHHSLSSALAGAAIPGLIIGLNHGVGEICQTTDNRDWALQFPMDAFCAEMRQQLQQFLRHWTRPGVPVATRDRCTRLLAQMQRIEELPSDRDRR